MSNNNNEMLKDKVFLEVMKMPTSSIIRELDGGKMLPGMCESFDMRVAMTDRDVVINRLVEQRLSTMEVLNG
jgi:hypothetical protein